MIPSWRRTQNRFHLSLQDTRRRQNKNSHILLLVIYLPYFDCWREQNLLNSPKRVCGFHVFYFFEWLLVIFRAKFVLL